jgi:hypothetical protein
VLVRLRESYLVGESSVKLDVEIGDGQKAYVEVLLNGNLLASGNSIGGLDVGLGPALSGKKLRITATVTDTNANTNHTSVTYTLSGGAANQSFQSTHDVDSAGDTVDYDAIFLLL